LSTSMHLIHHFNAKKDVQPGRSLCRSSQCCLWRRSYRRR